MNATSSKTLETHLSSAWLASNILIAIWLDTKAPQAEPEVMFCMASKTVIAMVEVPQAGSRGAVSIEVLHSQPLLMAAALCS